MAKFYLIGGHGEGDPGAVGNGYKEADLARQFNDLLAKHLKARKHSVSIYNKKRDMFQRTRNGKGLNVFGVNGRIVIETHLNGSPNKSAKGSEVLIAKGLKTDKYDTAIKNALAKHFNDRGIKYRDDLLNMNLSKKRGINYRLVELCFISNKEDVKYLIENMDKIAEDVAIALSGNQAPSKPKPKPKPQPTNPKPSKPKYTLLKGTKTMKKVHKYKVTASDGLRVRTAPKTNSKVFKTLKKDDTFKSLHYLDLNGYRWLLYITSGVIYYVAESTLKNKKSKYVKDIS